MNKAEFTNLIINPAKLGNEHIDTLKKIVADYPYFSTAQILLAKALSNTQHYQYEKQLKTTALCVANREVLNQFLNNIQVEIEPENTLIDVSDDLKAEKKYESDFEVGKLEQEALLIEAQNIILNNEIILSEIILEIEDLPEDNTGILADNIGILTDNFDYTEPILENIVNEFPEIETKNNEEIVKNDTERINEINFQLAETEGELVKYVYAESFLPDFDEASLSAEEQHIDTITKSVLPSSTNNNISFHEIEPEIIEKLVSIPSNSVIDGNTNDFIEDILTNSETVFKSNNISLENILDIDLENLNTPNETALNINFETVEKIVIDNEATIEAANLNFFEWLEINKKDTTNENAEIDQKQVLNYYEDDTFVSKIKQILKSKAEHDLRKNVKSEIEETHDNSVHFEQKINVSNSIVETLNNFNAQVESILPDFEALKAIELEEEKSYIIYDKKEGLIPNYETPVFDPLFNSYFETKPTETYSDENEALVDFNNFTLDNSLFENSFSTIYIPLPAKEIEILPINVKIETSKNEIDNILNKFMRENPSISRPKTEFFDPITVAKNSAEEKDEIVSETLASIYLKQGLIKKSILTYEKLCLIYPLKNAYFATLISKIKTEHNII